MLLNIETNNSNLVICRQGNPLFASSIPIGANQLADENMITRLVLELTACRRRFTSAHRHTQIERLIFLSGQTSDVQAYTTIAKQLEIQAQMGDCLAAVEVGDPDTCGIDRRHGNVSWATAFGLSLS
jgi:Tfp pilus assembly PilM family ATPase